MMRTLALLLWTGEAYEQRLGALASPRCGRLSTSCSKREVPYRGCVVRERECFAEVFNKFKEQI